MARIRKTNRIHQQSFGHSLQPVAKKIIHVLLRIAERVEVDACHSLVVTEPISEEDLVVLTNCPAHLISEGMQALQQRNLVSFRNKRIILRRPEALNALVFSARRDHHLSASKTAVEFYSYSPHRHARIDPQISRLFLTDSTFNQQQF